MWHFRPAQLKALSEFFNMLAVAWFTAGVIAPLYAKPVNLLNIIVSAIISIIIAGGFLALSLYLVRKIKL